MLVSEIISRARLLVGDTNSLQAQDAEIINWINDAIKEIIIQNSLCQKTATQALTPGTASYALPTDIYKLYSIRVDGEKLKLLTLQEWEQKNAGYGAGATNDNGTPNCAYVWAGQLTFSPTPAAAQTLVINYIYEPVSLTIADVGNSPVIPDTYHLRIVTYIMAQYALMDEDTSKYGNLLAAFQSGILDLKYQSQGEEDLYPFISVSERDAGSEYGSYQTW